MSFTKKFAWGGAAVALAVLVSMATLVNTASATVETFSTPDALIAPGEATTVNVFVMDAAPGLTETVTIAVNPTSTAQGSLGDAATQTLACVITVVVAQTDASCDNGTANATAAQLALVGGTPFTVTARANSGSTQGELRLIAEHDGDTETLTIFVVSATGGASDIVVVTAPQTIADEGGTAAITVRTNDTSGSPINGVALTVNSTRGNLRQVGNVCTTATADPFTDNSCTITTSTTSSGNVGRATVNVQETGFLGENVEVVFFTSTVPPLFEQVNMEIVGQAAPGQVTISASPSPIPAGGTSTVTVTAKDADGDVVADNTVVNVEATAGTVTGCSNNLAGDLDSGQTRNGVVTCTYTAPPTAQTVTLTATVVTPTGADIVVTTTLQVTGTAATATATGTPSCTGAIVSGSIPRTGGFGLIVAGCGTIQQIETNTGCPIATMALWATRGGNFIVHVPGTQIGAVNAEFLATFPGGNIPQNEPFVGKCV